MKKKIQELSLEIFKDVLEIRRHIHANPELSFEEYNTSNYVQYILKTLEVPFTNGWVKTGIVAHIEGKNPSKKIIALRADLDALPINEQNQTDFVSRNKGVMHACGHDVHTASLLGAAMILNQLKNEFEGTVKLIFQPGEEKLPGGAKLMMEEGCLKNPDAELIIGQHVFPEMETGRVGFRKGMYMASTDELHLTVNGKGGHAALPHQYTNNTLAASEFILKANEVHENLKSQLIPSVIAFGKIIAEGATNVIPAEVKVEGTMRTLDESFRNNLHIELKKLASELSGKYNCRVDLEIRKGYPVLYNNEDVTNFCIGFANEYLGADKVDELELRMTAEDFAYYSQKIPACFYRLGTRNETLGITSPVHTSTFDIDEEALKTGSGLMAFMAVKLLEI